MVCRLARRASVPVAAITSRGACDRFATLDASAAHHGFGAKGEDGERVPSRRLLYALLLSVLSFHRLNYFFEDTYLVFDAAVRLARA